MSRGGVAVSAPFGCWPLGPEGASFPGLVAYRVCPGANADLMMSRLVRYTASDVQRAHRDVPLQRGPFPVAGPERRRHTRPPDLRPDRQGVAPDYHLQAHGDTAALSVLVSASPVQVGWQVQLASPLSAADLANIKDIRVVGRYTVKLP
jgi:hypothetical protein